MVSPVRDSKGRRVIVYNMSKEIFVKYVLSIIVSERCNCEYCVYYSNPTRIYWTAKLTLILYLNLLIIKFNVT